MKKIQKLIFKQKVVKKGSGLVDIADVLIALGEEIIVVKKKINEIIDEMEGGGL